MFQDIVFLFLLAQRLRELSMKLMFGALEILCNNNNNNNNNELSVINGSHQVLLGMTMTCFYSFARSTIAILLRKEGGHRGLLWAGYSVQAGSCMGTILGFVLVNVLHVFQDKPMCPGM